MVERGGRRDMKFDNGDGVCGVVDVNMDDWYDWYGGW